MTGNDVKTNVCNPDTYKKLVTNFQNNKVVKSKYTPN